MASSASQPNENPEGGSSTAGLDALVVGRAGDSKPLLIAVHGQSSISYVVALVAGGGPSGMHSECELLDNPIYVVNLPFSFDLSNAQQPHLSKFKGCQCRINLAIAPRTQTPLYMKTIQRPSLMYPYHSNTHIRPHIRPQKLFIHHVGHFHASSLLVSGQPRPKLQRRQKIRSRVFARSRSGHASTTPHSHPLSSVISSPILVESLIGTE